MTTIATDVYRQSDWLKFELHPEVAFARKKVILTVDAATTLLTGTVLGKVTATGKYKVAKEDATDGSEIADAILFLDVPVVVGDNNVVVINKFAQVGDKGLVLDQTYNTDAKKQAVYDALEAKDIQVLKSL